MKPGHKVSSPPTLNVSITFDKIAEHATDRAENPEKQPRNEVNYAVATSPSRCGSCDFGTFEKGFAIGSCSKVAGQIQSGMTCELYNNQQVNNSTENSEVQL